MLFSKSDIQARVILYRIYDLLSISILSINLPSFQINLLTSLGVFCRHKLCFYRQGSESGRGHTPTHPAWYVRTCTVFPIPTEAICNYFFS